MASITVQERTTILKLVAGMFNAAPGATFLNGFTDAFVAMNKDYAALATALGQSEPFKSLYPSFLTAEEFANKFLATLGLKDNTNAQDWVQARKNAGEDNASIIFQALVAIETSTADEFKAARDQLANKAAVAEHYSVTLQASSNDLAALQNVVAKVTADPASVTAANEANAGGNGKTFTLTQGLDTIVGTAGNDTINAFAFNAVTGADTTTLNSVDSIDGGAGNDTLNIEVKGAAAFNATLQGTIKNVETINIDNTGNTGAAPAVDASLFQGATAINQISTAAAVTKLAAGTTAGFNGIAAGVLNVTAADAAASAAVALTNVDDASSLTVLATPTGTLNAVTVSGTVVDSAADGVDPIALAVTVGKDVETLTVNTAVDVTLTITDGAGTKKVSTINAAASTGAINYADTETTVANISTGSGADDVTLVAALDATVKTASVTTGAGDDKVDVNVTSSATGNKVTVDAGAGADEITVTSLGATAAALDVKAGDGDDTVILAGALNTAARIDGGAGTDALQLATGGALVAEDYALIRGVVSNVEHLTFGAAATIDGDELLQFSQITFAAGANTANDVAASQSLVANTNLTATAKGYVASTATAAAEGAALTIKALATGAVVANGATVDLTVAPAENGNAATTTLTGDFNSAKVTLTSSVDKVAGVATADNIAAVSFTAAGANATSLTLTGNGLATISNAAGKLATVDASGLTGVSFNGDILANATAGLTYTGNAAVKESITLGAAQDKVTVASTYSVLDTITGFDAVKETNTAKSTTDILVFDGVDLTGAVAAQATKITLSANATSLELAFVEAAAADAVDTNVSFFQFEGNTYLFSNKGTAALEAADVAVKIVGLVDFADDWGVFTA